MPALMCGAAGGSEPELNCTVPLSSACNRVAAALEDDLFQLRQLLAHLEHLELAICGVVPIGGVAQLNLSGLARASATNSFIVFAGSSDLTTNVLGEVAKLADAHEVLERVIGDLGVETGVDRIGIGREQDRVAVWFGACRVAHADIAAGAADVFDDEGLAGRLLKRGRDDARPPYRTGRPACWRPPLSPADRDMRHRRSARAEKPARQRPPPTRPRP